MTVQFPGVVSSHCVARFGTVVSDRRPTIILKACQPYLATPAIAGNISPKVIPKTICRTLKFQLKRKFTQFHYLRTVVCTWLYFSWIYTYIQPNRFHMGCTVVVQQIKSTCSAVAGSEHWYLFNTSSRTGFSQDALVMSLVHSLFFRNASSQSISWHFRI